MLNGICNLCLKTIIELFEVKEFKSLKKNHIYALTKKYVIEEQKN